MHHCRRQCFLDHWKGLNNTLTNAREVAKLHAVATIVEGQQVMTLKDDDIVTTKVQSRRKFLARAGRVVAGAIGVGAASPASARGKPADHDTSDPKTVVDNDGRDGSIIDGDGRDKPKGRAAKKKQMPR